MGSYEVLLDDTREAARKAREAWDEVEEYLRIVYRIRREPDGAVVKKVKNRKRETEDRAKKNLLAFLKRELL